MPKFRIEKFTPVFSVDKPDIVIELQKFVERELSKLHLQSPDEIPEQTLETKQYCVDERLQVFREAWGILLKKHVSYSALLKNIRNAYEDALAVRDIRIEDMDTLKKSLLVIEAKAEEKLALLRSKGCTEIAHLMEEKICLLQKIDDLKSERATQVKIIDKLNDELTFEHKCLMEQIDLRRLLTLEIKHLQQQMDIVQKKIAVKTTSVECDTEDPVVLRFALTKCQEVLSETQRKLSDIEANFTEVVPKRDMEKLQDNYTQLTQQITNLNKQKMFLQSQYQTLEYKYEEAKLQYNHLLNKENAMSNTGTPRPDWDKCAEFVKGGIKRWNELTGDKSSNDRLIIFLNELGSDEVDDQIDYFQGRGTDEAIPAYLRFEGKIKNRRLTRRDLSILINDIWKERNQSPHLPMEEFVAKYFQDHLPIPIMQYEWAYSMVHSCEKLSHDGQIGLFWGILNGTLQESIYFLHIKDINLCKDLSKQRLQIMNLKEGIMPQLVFSEVVHTAFPFKTDRQVASLVKAATKHPGTKPGSVNVNNIFEEQSEEGMERTMFAEELAHQTRIDKEKFVNDLMNVLGFAKEPFKLIPPDQLKKAFNIINSQMDDLQVDNYLNWVYGEKNLKVSKPVELSFISMKLLMAGINKTTMK